MTTDIPTTLFPFGKVLATPGVMENLGAQDDLLFLLFRHTSGDWGDLCDGDKAANDAALFNGGRLFSSYLSTASPDGKIWIITEAEDDDGARSYTTILLPSEY